jgi:hypothetical protein
LPVPQKSVICVAILKTTAIKKISALQAKALYRLLPPMTKVKSIIRRFCSTRFPVRMGHQVITITPCDDSFESSFVCSSRSARPMTPSGCVRGRSATPGPREVKVLYNLLFVVWPQVSTCEKKEPMSTH